MDILLEDVCAENLDELSRWYATRIRAVDAACGLLSTLL